MRLGFLGLCLGVGCAGSEPEGEDMGRQLTRLSLDLRGVRPSLEELSRADSEEAIGEVAEQWMRGEGFSRRVRDLYAEVYRTRTELWYLNTVAAGVSDVPEGDLHSSLGEEVLQIVARVAAEDLPYTELVQGDWTVADPILATLSPIEHSGGEGWEVSRYTDGRPSAGVLSTNSLWWRYDSTESNANRKRANAVSRIFLCHDHMDQPVIFDPELDLLDTEAVNEAVSTDPNCTSCHTTLDPLAGFLYGFWWQNPIDHWDYSHYHPEREPYWQQTTDTPPAFYGEPGTTLEDLSSMLSEDPRFSRCAVESMWELLLREEPGLEDFDAISSIQEDFESDGMRIRDILRGVTASDAYRDLSALKMASPELMASQIEGLTGFHFTARGVDLMRTDKEGYRTLAGGSDYLFVDRRAEVPNATVALVQERLAEAAAEYGLSRGALLSPEALQIDPRGAPEAFESALQGLSWRARGVPLRPQEVSDYQALWVELYALDRDPASAWAGLSSAMLREAELLFY